MKLNDCECIQSCFKTILEMLQDRNYIVNDRNVSEIAFIKKK